jgi:serine/threonine protein kinase
MSTSVTGPAATTTHRVGLGAVAPTVLLVEDKVVDERLVLKFLNPNVSQDEEMLKRFVHELRYSRKITHPARSEGALFFCLLRQILPCGFWADCLGGCCH